MNPALKFIYFSLPAIAAGLLVVALMGDKEGEPWAAWRWTLLVMDAPLLLLNALIYRRHVKQNGWLKWADRYRYMKAVTTTGPLGQFIYYFREIHPYDPFREDPPKDMEDDSQLTDADKLF